MTTANYDAGGEAPVRAQIWRSINAAGGGSWITVPNLFVDQLRVGIQPNNGPGNATLRYYCGDIAEHDQPGINVVRPLGAPASVLNTVFGVADNIVVDVMRRPIRIQKLNAGTGLVEYSAVLFVTQLDTEELKNFGVGNVSDASSYGNQTVICSGPEWFLQRQQVSHSRVEGYARRVETTLPFNIDGNGTAIANKQTGQLRFNPDPINSSDAEAWNAQHILEYVAAEFLPVLLREDGAATNAWDHYPVLTWTLNNQVAIKDITPRMEPSGSVFDLISQIVSPRRMHYWSIRYIPGATDAVFGTFQLSVHTGSSTPVVLSGKTLVTANPDVKAISTEGFVRNAKSLSRNASQVFEAVEVRGDRIGHVLTFQPHADDWAQEDWTSAEETEYVNGITDSVDVDENETNTRALRMGKLRYVFTRFLADLTTQPAEFDSDAYLPNIRWDSATPLIEGYDYSVDPPAPPASKKVRAQIPIRVFYKYQTPKGVTNYAYGDTLPQLTMTETFNAGKLRAINVKPRTDAFGLTLQPYGPPHHHAKHVSITVGDKNTPALFSYRTDAWITGYVQEDLRVRAVVPVLGVGDGTQANRLVIDVGEFAKLTYLHPETYVGLDEKGQLIKSPNAKNTIRDDSAFLSELANLAYRYYSVPRFAYRYQTHVVDHSWHPGQLFNDANSPTQDSIVTEVVHNYVADETAIATAYAQPDVTSLAETVRTA